MTPLMPPLDDILMKQAHASNLTYFAFDAAQNGKPRNAKSAKAPTKASIGTLPDVLGGRYRIERLLGAGGMGAVYRAKDLLSEQFGDPDPYIALKILSEEFAESPDASVLLYSEFALTRLLRHNNVLRLHTFEVDAHCQRPFITMELMRGFTLDKLLCERPLGLPWKELRDIALPLLDGLAYAHARGVVHGDMKPSNVMLSDDGVRLFDFGLGQAQEGVLPGLPRLNRKCFNAWTPGYAAPELLQGEPLTAAADVYGVACLLYELAGGKHPFRRLPSTEARDANLERELRAPPNLPKHCWPELREALSFDPVARVTTVSRLRRALGEPASWCEKWSYRMHLTKS
ncbi:serine/threonine-protein kinase [Pseudomonas sp. P8_241]|jgi:serine/threonine-protein kinase Stk1|uniref:serine/threonine-protein kinase n=1 Tax=Pseudomonas sp. P8_241 TaxID=3043445 RepID=UPI002A36CF07|nr:serine/threonine-protein kinase [Pseudomonas sp. P8_241]WPN45363.1 serine/threonine-protein kinase [Pseudomonas sp. P8_241]